MLPGRAGVEVILRQGACGADFKPSGCFRVRLPVKLPSIGSRPTRLKEGIRIIAHQPVMSIHGDVRIDVKIITDAEAFSQRVRIGCHLDIMESQTQGLVFDARFVTVFSKIWLSVYRLTIHFLQVSKYLIEGAVLFDDKNDVPNLLAGFAGWRNGRVR